MEKFSVGKRKLRQLKGQKITVKEDPKGFTSEERELFIAQGKGKNIPASLEVRPVHTVEQLTFKINFFAIMTRQNKVDGGKKLVKFSQAHEIQFDKNQRNFLVAV
jgi:hypothetical protein